MSTSHDNILAMLAGIDDRISRITARRDAAAARIAALEKRIADLQADLDNTRKELHQAHLDVEFLTLSHRLADSPDALAAARKTIASLIRKVDVAISMLKNDPAQE